MKQTDLFDQTDVKLVGWDYGMEIPKQIGPNIILDSAQPIIKIILVDVSFEPQLMIELRMSKHEFIWIDHHKSAIQDSVKHNYQGMAGTRDMEFAACELTWKYFFPGELTPELVRLLGRYDCFGHKGTDEEKEVLEFQYGARAYMSNYQECYEHLQCNTGELEMSEDVLEDDQLQIVGNAIYKYLCTEAQQIYEKGFPVEFAEQTEEIAKETGRPVFKVRKFLCVNRERFNPINFGIDYHKDGYDGFACFWYKNGKWNFSLYSEKVDCSVIAKQYGGGGHKGAAGFTQVYNSLGYILKKQ